MKIIESFEKAIREKQNLVEAGINPTMFWAYMGSKEAGNELIDFHEVIWDREIPEIVRVCRENGIKEFTISNTMSSLIGTLAEFEKFDCKIVGLTQVNAKYTDFLTGKRAVVPAIKMVL